jgi:putative tricarboxylic transport membrane protein
MADRHEALQFRTVLLLLGLFVSASTDAADDLHFLIPGGAGGGWDTTARAVGSALEESGLIERASYENRSGAGGAKGFAYMLDRRARSESVLMVNSTPILVRTLQPEFHQNWRQLTPVAAVIGDYGALMVRADAPWSDLRALIRTLVAAPRSVKFAGGSNRGDLDHLILAAAFKAFGLQPRDARYVPYGAGGAATLALLSGETPAMTATIGDAMGPIRDGSIRVLAIAAPKRLAQLPEVPTFGELGYPFEFLNWRGFFAVPDADRLMLGRFESLLSALSGSPAWQQALVRHGWIAVEHRGEAFAAYLDRQEGQIRELLRALEAVPVARVPQ